MSRRRDDSGQVGGIEVLPFGLLIFVVGSLMIANAWAVLDAKFATDAAAREAVRAFVEASPDSTDPLGAARRAGLAAIEGHGRDPARAVVAPIGPAALTRCARVTFEAVYTVPALALPFLGGLGQAPFKVRSTSSGLVDPFRSALAGQAGDCL